MVCSHLVDTESGTGLEIHQRERKAVDAVHVARGLCAASHLGEDGCDHILGSGLSTASCDCNYLSTTLIGLSGCIVLEGSECIWSCNDSTTLSDERNYPVLFSFVYQDGRSALLACFCSVVVTIAMLASDCDEERALLYLPGVIGGTCYYCIPHAGGAGQGCKFSCRNSHQFPLAIRIADEASIAS